MLSFQNIYEECQEQTQDSSSASLTLFKRAINQGAKQFGAILNREWKNTQKTFSIDEDKQYYQLPEDAIRLKSLVVVIGGIQYVLKEVPDEDTWNIINERVDTSDIPEFYYIKGSDEFGIYPVPATSVTDAGRINYERRTRDMSAADYSTGTVSLTLNSATVEGTSVTFTSAMVGRYLKVSDPNGDGMWYKIASYVDSTHITLENKYAGATASGLSYTIGELPDIPEEYHESLIDYGCYRYYLRRRDLTIARELKSIYLEAISSCQANYSSKTSSQYFRPVKLRNGFVYRRRRDYEVT